MIRNYLIRASFELPTRYFTVRSTIGALVQEVEFTPGVVYLTLAAVSQEEASEIIETLTNLGPMHIETWIRDRNLDLVFWATVMTPSRVESRAEVTA